MLDAWLYPKVSAIECSRRLENQPGLAPRPASQQGDNHSFAIESSLRALAPGFGDLEMQPGLAPRPASQQGDIHGFRN